MVSTHNLVGPGGRLFAELRPSPDEVAFRVDNTSAAYYNSPYFTLHKNQVQPVPKPRGNKMDLADVAGPDIITGAQVAGKITFHSVGDTGAAKVNRSQTAGTAIKQEATVADTMAADVSSGAANAPAFFFHLGDVVYQFGEAQYYYDQFYEPYRAYDRPIFAIPGNHDGMVFGKTSATAQVPSLEAFLRNFCAAKAGPSPDSGGLVRSAMSQPGVYFTLDAPFVSIIGLYSNVLDGPGVISSQGGHFTTVGDDQLTFLKSELQRLAPDRKAGKRAIILAVHHPPLSADSKHSGSDGLSNDIDTACKAAGLWPDMVLSGHAHLYQRFTRRVGQQEIPYVVAGSGGFATTPPLQKLPHAPVTVGDHTLEIDPLIDFGYLTLTTDGHQLTVSFNSPATRGSKQLDTVTVDLQKGKLATKPRGAKAVGKAVGRK